MGEGKEKKEIVLEHGFESEKGSKGRNIKREKGERRRKRKRVGEGGRGLVREEKIFYDK